MMNIPKTLTAFAVAALAIATGADGTKSGEWTELIGAKGLEAWTPATDEWSVVGAVRPSPSDPKRLAGDAGTGIIFNGPSGRARNLLTKEKYGPVELHAEFLVPKGSNSGIKFEALYEVQIADSWGVKTPKASDCGGIYPRAELGPPYRHIDQGYPPRVNASRPPGEWQSLEVIFVPPRFDSDGKKVADARFVKVVLNGQVLHERLSVPTPTGHAWHSKEIPAGPILLQGDHGPVAFRNIRVRSWTDENAH